MESRKNDLTLKGVLGLAFLGLSLVVFYYTLSTDYWFMGVALMVLVIVYFGWAIFTSQRPRT